MQKEAVKLAPAKTSVKHLVIANNQITIFSRVYEHVCVNKNIMLHASLLGIGKSVRSLYSEFYGQKERSSSKIISPLNR